MSSSDESDSWEAWGPSRRWALALVLLVGVLKTLSQYNRAVARGEAHGFFTDGLLIYGSLAGFFGLLWIWMTRHRRLAKRLKSREELSERVSTVIDPYLRNRLVSMEYEMARAWTHNNGHVGAPSAFVFPEARTRNSVPFASIPFVVLLLAGALPPAAVFFWLAAGMLRYRQEVWLVFLTVIPMGLMTLALAGSVVYRARTPMARHMRKVLSTGRLSPSERWPVLLQLAKEQPSGRTANKRINLTASR